MRVFIIQGGGLPHHAHVVIYAGDDIEKAHTLLEDVLTRNAAAIESGQVEIMFAVEEQRFTNDIAAKKKT